MPITFACPCGKQLRVGDQYAGKRAQCPACQSVLDVPAAPDDPFAAPPPPDESPAYRMRDEPPTAPTARRVEAEDARRTDTLNPDDFRRRDRDDPPRARHREIEEGGSSDDPRDRTAGGPHVPTILGGVFSLALGGLLCWLRNGVSVVGIILLIAGLVSVVKGLLGYQDE